MITLTTTEKTVPQIFGLLGYGIKYSMSPMIHNHIFSRFGINAFYGIFDVPPDGFQKALTALAKRASGFNVTKPYKEDTARIIPELSEEASMTGSVNLVKKNRGYNTDYLALKGLVGSHSMDLAGKNCTIFGSGGAARTAAFLFGKLRMNVNVINRSLERARKLEADLSGSGIQAHAIKLDPGLSSTEIASDVIVNCISQPDFRYPALEADLAVDFNYSSRSGDFRDRLKGSHSLITGEEILVAQAIHSQMIWNNIRPGFEEIMEVINVKHTG